MFVVFSFMLYLYVCLLNSLFAAVIDIWYCTRIASTLMCQFLEGLGELGKKIFERMRPFESLNLSVCAERDVEMVFWPPKTDNFILLP